MDARGFDYVINRQIGLSKEILIEKAKEYATEDRLHNFRVAAQLQNCTMEQALGGFMCKHTVSIYDMVNSGTTYPNDKWDEKITDHINYLLILRAIVEETNRKKIFDLSEDECIRRQLKQEPVFTGVPLIREKISMEEGNPDE